MRFLPIKTLVKKNYFLFFVMLCFVFVSSSALAISKDPSLLSSVSAKVNSITKLNPLTKAKSFPKNPVLGTETSYPVISAQGALAVDLDSGVPLYEKNTDERLLPASTTKIVTAIVALDSYSLDQVLTVPRSAHVDGQKMGLYTGEQMKVEDLLYGLLVFSANDAAMTLAHNYPVSTESGVTSYSAFVSAMNEKAKKLSMTNSNFENPVGLDGVVQTTTARDLVRVSEVAIKNPTFSRIVGTKSVVVSDVTGKSKYYLKNINELLGKVPGVMGVKTGWTENARENLVTYIERDGHRVMIAILGSQDRFGETKELIDWIFTNYEWQEVKLP